MEFFGDEVDRIAQIDSLTGEVKLELDHIAIFPNSHYVVEKEKMEQAAQALYNKYETAVLCKGGHSIEDANDYLYGADGGNWLESKRIDNQNTHGTGCTLSSAIASYLAQNCELTDAVIKAKEYISGALADGMDLGQGSGPLNHAFRFNPSKN